MGSSYLHLYYHFVWGTYKRFAWIDEKTEFILRRLIRDKVIELKSELLAFGCAADHIHILVKLHPSLSVAGFVGEIKGYTSYMIANQIYPDLGFRWQGGYGAFTVPFRDLSRLTKYIENQRTHHQESTVNCHWEVPEKTKRPLGRFGID